MRVLQINSVCGIGSTGRIATDLHALLEAQGHDSWIAYGRGEAKNCEKTIKIGSNFDNYGHVVKSRIHDKHGFGSINATKKFIEKIEKMNFDIIHLHNIHGYYINVELLFEYLKKSNKKIIWTLHDCWAFTGHCSHFDYISCDRWKDGCFKCPQKNEYPAAIVFENSKRNYTYKKDLFTGVNNLVIVAPSLWLKNLVKYSFLNEYEVKVINNGVDLNVFRPISGYFRKEKKLEDKFIILGVANIWGEKKGFNEFLELSKMLNSNDEIVLIGVSKKQQRLLPQNIKGINRTENLEELAAMYSTADVFVNPTLEDTFPTTNLESIACGTPVISYPTGGSIESIKTNTGIVTKEKSVDNLYSAIQYLKENKIAKKEILKETMKFDKNISSMKYLECYKKMNKGD